MYVSEMFRRFPADMVELPAYMSQIHKASQEFMGTAWVNYETTFRKQAAASGIRRWRPLMRASLCFMGKVTPGRYCDGASPLLMLRVNVLWQPTTQTQLTTGGWLNR